MNIAILEFHPASERPRDGEIVLVWCRCASVNGGTFLRAEFGQYAAKLRIGVEPEHDPDAEWAEYNEIDAMWYLPEGWCIWGEESHEPVLRPALKAEPVVWWAHIPPPPEGHDG